MAFNFKKGFYMKKFKKIATIVLCLVVCATIFTVSTFAYTYTGESGQEYTIPNTIDGKYIHTIDSLNFNQTYSDDTYPIKTSSANFLKNDGVRIENNSIINDYYGTPYYYPYENSAQVEIELPNLSSGLYTVSFDMEFFGDGYYCTPSNSLLLLKSPGLGNFQTLMSITDGDISRYLDKGYNFSTLTGAKFTIEMTFNFDANKLNVFFVDLNGEYILYTSDLNNFPKDLPIVLRYQIQSNSSKNPHWSETTFSNFIFWRSGASFTEYELSLLKDYFDSISSSEGQLKYGPVIESLNKDIVDLGNDVDILENELSTMTDKYDNAKEGLENSNAVLNFFQGCYEAVHGVLTDIFGLEVFGFSFGNIAAVLLIAFFVIFILKLVF